MTYNGTLSESVIRTNGGKLIVNAPSSHVEHYYIANEVDVQAVSDSTYVENGVVGKMTVAAGAKNVIVKSGAVVGEIASSSENLNVENGGFVARVSGPEIKSGTVAEREGVATVSTYEQLQGLALASTAGVQIQTIELDKDIVLTGKSWQPFGFSSANAFSGTIDGKGHKIIGLSNGTYIGEKSTTSTTKIHGEDYDLLLTQRATL